MNLTQLGFISDMESPVIHDCITTREVPLYSQLTDVLHLYNVSDNLAVKVVIITTAANFSFWPTATQIMSMESTVMKVTAIDYAGNKAECVTIVTLQGKLCDH